MANIYLSSTLLWNGSMEEIFDMVFQSGLDGIELWSQQFFYRKFDIDEFEKLAALYPLKNCIHSQSWDLNISSVNDGIRKQSVTEVKKSVELAYQLGLDEVTVHPGHCTISGIGVSYGIIEGNSGICAEMEDRRVVGDYGENTQRICYHYGCNEGGMRRYV